MKDRFPIKRSSVLREFRFLFVLILLVCCLNRAHADVEMNLLLFNANGQCEAKAEGIAAFIEAQQANLIGLVDVEHRTALDKVVSHLPASDTWAVVFDDGVDAEPTHRVGILTTLSVESGIIDGFAHVYELYMSAGAEKETRASNLLAVELSFAQDPLYVLIAKLGGDTEDERLAQANIARRAIVKAMMDEKHVIVMGHHPNSTVIQRLRGFDDVWGNLIDTASAGRALISQSLRQAFFDVAPERRYQTVDTGQLSTDKAVRVSLKVVQPVVLIETNKGNIEVELYPNAAPLTVANFLKLVEQEFYDGLTFHRYVENFVIQGGDPLGNGTGGPGWTIPGEFQNPKLRAKMPRHVKGIVAMARANHPDSAGSQFYICLDPSPSRYFSLNGQYTTFGRVIAGLEVVDQLRQGDVMNTVRVKPREGND